MVISSGLDNQLKYVNEQRRKSVESLCSVFEKKISVTVGLTIEIKLRFHFFQSQHGRGLRVVLFFVFLFLFFCFPVEAQEEGGDKGMMRRRGLVVRALDL